MRNLPAYTPTPQSLARAALHYLERYAASEALLRRVLQGRLRRAAMRNPALAANQEQMRDLRSAIETIIEAHKKSGAVNDAAFAETKINSLRRQGRSKRAIQQKLAVAGIGGDLVAAALAKNADGAEAEEVELTAALAYARRRKLGPFRSIHANEDRRRKDFAALARAGFSSSIARLVLKAEPPDERDV